MKAPHGGRGAPRAASTGGWAAGIWEREGERERERAAPREQEPRPGRRNLLMAGRSRSPSTYREVRTSY
ncbi:MAG: hypothetical protein ACP5G6_08730 [Conexivisphaera sp.]